MSSNVLLNTQHCLWKIIDVQDDIYFSRGNLSYPLTNSCSKTKTGLIQATLIFVRLCTPLAYQLRAFLADSEPQFSLFTLLTAPHTFFLLSAWLFSLLSTFLKNVTNASSWKPEYSLHPSSPRHLGSSSPVSRPELQFVLPVCVRLLKALLDSLPLSLHLLPNSQPFHPYPKLANFLNVAQRILESS